MRPCKIIADKDTTKHRTRQLICLTTVFPEAKDFIQTLYIDHPLIKHHKTKDVAENIVTSVKEYISEDSYAGGSYDGAYFHANKDVSKHVNEAFNVNDEAVHSDHDAMHRSSLAEKRARKKVENNWLNKLGKNIATAFKDHNYGKKYEELKDQAQLMEIELLEPKFHSETRFANSCSQVFNTGYRDLSVLIETYKKTRDENVGSNLQEERDKAKHAADMLKVLNNKKSMLQLAGTCDIYSQFSAMVCNLQKVNVLPHERYSQYQDRFNKMRHMMDSISDHSECASQECHWPKYHTDRENILKGKFGKLSVLSDEGEPADKVLRSYFKRPNQAKDPFDKSAENNLKTVLKDLLDELKDVFREVDIKVIETTRPLTDWSGLALKLKTRSQPIVYALEKKTFVDSCYNTARSVKCVERSEIENQFYKFTKRLEKITQHKSYEQLKKTDSKELIQTFGSSPSLYEGIELVMRATYEASVKLSVESVAESVISVYNLHNNQLRKLNEDTANDELFVAYNGPEIGEADEVLRQALNLHFSKTRGGWNFSTQLFKTAGVVVEKKLREKIN